eukprot:SAG31_NODE_13_length_37961_cov_21.751307_24_plen_77_part_00
MRIMMRMGPADTPPVHHAYYNYRDGTAVDGARLARAAAARARAGESRDATRRVDDCRLNSSARWRRQTFLDGFLLA